MKLLSLLAIVCLWTIDCRANNLDKYQLILNEFRAADEPLDFKNMAGSFKGACFQKDDVKHPRYLNIIQKTEVRNEGLGPKFEYDCNRTRIAILNNNGTELAQSDLEYFWNYPTTEGLNKLALDYVTFGRDGFIEINDCGVLIQGKLPVRTAWANGNYTRKNGESYVYNTSLRKGADGFYYAVQYEYPEREKEPDSPERVCYFWSKI